MDGYGMSKTNLVKLLVLSSIVGVTVFLAFYSRQPQPVEKGEKAPDFLLPTLADNKISLSDLHGRVVVLNFWATWCPPCVEETPSLNRFSEQMEAQGVTVIGVSVDRDAAALEKFVANAQLIFPIARDPQQTVSSRYGTFKFPESYIIDLDGRIAEKLIGAVNWQDERIVNLVSGLARARKSP